LQAAKDMMLPDDIPSTLIGQELDSKKVKADIEIMKDNQKQEDISQTVSMVKEDEGSIFNAKTIKSKADALLKTVQEKGTALFNKPSNALSTPLIPQLSVQRGSFGMEITEGFSILEREIFGSLDGSLINSTVNYPFASKMQHA
jgi:hypothetical protein